MENVEIDNQYECLILNNAINECKLAEKVIWKRNDACQEMKSLFINTKKTLNYKE